MKFIYNILLLLTTTLSFCQIQSGFYNHVGGTIQMHEEASLGIHTHLANDGIFNENKGFTGFYSVNEILTVSGVNRTVFNNVEIDVVNNLELYTSLGVTKELLFMSGKVITPRTDLAVSLDFMNHDFYAGENNASHVDGYTSITGLHNFTFPIGDDERLRPMSIPNRSGNNSYLGAYFYEDPNTPTTFSDNFVTSEKKYLVETVSTYEFWDLNGNTETNVTLTWDSLSNVNLIAPDIDMLIVVGWNIANNRWEDLGNINMTGDFNTGTITSIPFIPNEYEIITLGSIGEISNNYYISPNGDGLGDTLVFEELIEDFKISKLIIFNRWGNLIYTKENYGNDFAGISEGRATLNKKKELPTGTYFYELKYGEDTEFTQFKKGWIYISQ